MYSVAFGRAILSKELTHKAGIQRQCESTRSQDMDITEAIKHSPILARLVEEVRNEKAVDPQSYNRMHNRHNRSR